jgi:hypothetical protein
VKRAAGVVIIGGVMHAPAAGLALAELITHGQAEAFDLGPYRAGRFGADPKGALRHKPAQARSLGSEGAEVP